jgi:hypothetical protein
MDSSSKDIESPREINEECGAYPNDPEDVRKFGELLVNITTNKGDYVLPFPITTLVIFFCYQIETDLQTDISKIYCLIGFITNSVSNFVKSRPDIKDSIDQMSEKELEDVIYPQILEMLNSPMVESKSGGKRKGKKTQKRRRRGGMLSRFGKMGSRATAPFISAVSATVRGTYRLAGAIKDWLPEILTIIYFAYHIFYFLYYVRLIRIKTGSALTPNDPIFSEWISNVTSGVKSGEYLLLDPNITTGLVPVGDISREMQIYAPGGTRVEEFIKNAQFLSTFLLGTMLRRQYSFGNMLVSSVQSVETQISVPGPNEMSKKLFKVVVKGMMDDCFSDVPPKMIIAEANFLNELMTEHAPLLAHYSQQFTDSIKAALPSDIEVSAESSIQGPPKLPGITSTDIDKEGDIVEDEKGDIVEDEKGDIVEDEEGNILEDEEGDIVEDEEGDIHQEDVISPPEQLESKKSVGVFGTITNFFGGVFDTALETETGKKATEVVTILDRQSVLYSNPEIRGQCMLESAENMRKTIELEAQLLAVQLRRIKTKFMTIWSMEKENAAKAIHHLCKAACALTFYAGVKILTRRAAAPADDAPAGPPPRFGPPRFGPPRFGPPGFGPPSDDDDDDDGGDGDMGANALVRTGRGIEPRTRSFGTQIASFADTGTSPMNNSDSNSNSYSSSSSLVSSSNPSGSGSNASSAANPSINRGNKSPIKTALLRQAAIEEQRKKDEEQNKNDAAYGLLALKERKGGRRTRRRTRQTKKRRRPIKRRQTRKLRRNTKRRRM